MTDSRRELVRLFEAQEQRRRFDWSRQARPNQLLPDGDWTTALFIAGRGFGKTRIISETARFWTMRQGFDRVNFIAATDQDARDILIEGESGVLAVCPPEDRPEYFPARQLLRWPNGARSQIFTADTPERLRGHQHEKLLCDELMAWRFPREALDMARMGLRLGKRPQMIIATTPKPSKLLRELIAEPGTVVTRGTSYENRDNLAPQFFAHIVQKYQGTRLGRQELEAEILDDNPGALFHQQHIDEARVARAPELQRVIVAVDPAVTANEDSDETGILVCGCDGKYPANFYVLDDLSLIASPDAWGRKAVTAYHARRADRIVAETNQGGLMVESVIRNVDPNVSYKAVTATRGKVLRAEPIAALYEQQRVHHVGTFADLETQMTEWCADSSESPDRLDALVWALTELSANGGGHGLLEYFESGRAKEDLMKIDAGMTDVDKAVTTSTVAKPATNDQTEACPKCGSNSPPQRVSTGMRCQQCGHQWPIPGKTPFVQRGMSRAEALNFDPFDFLRRRE